MDFLPYAHNENYVHLPLNFKFCLKYGIEELNFNTDDLGGRFFLNPKNALQVFGDSQVLGLDIDAQTDHYLYKHFKKDFIIYAAPNNGPYEVLNFIKLHKKKIKKKIIINLNLSVDLFRLYSDWDIKNYVAIKSNQLDDIVEKPYKYKILITKNLLSNKYFTVARKNEKEMRELFMTRNVQILKNNIELYLLKLKEISKELSLEINYILIMPYWIYEVQNKKIIKIKSIDERFKILLCDTFSKNLFLKSIKISTLKSINNDILTLDKRHLRSDKISLTSLNKYCNF